MHDLSQDIDDVLSMKLSIEPTSATASSLNELAGLSQQIISTLSQAAGAYGETAKQASNFREILSQIDADKQYANSTMTLQNIVEQQDKTNEISTTFNKELVLDKFAVDNSLDVRRIKHDREDVDAITLQGFEESFAKTLQTENGKLTDQLSGVVSRIGNDIKTLFTSKEDQKTPRILFDKSDEQIQRIIDAIEEQKEHTNNRTVLEEISDGITSLRLQDNPTLEKISDDIKSMRLKDDFTLEDIFDDIASKRLQDDHTLEDISDDVTSMRLQYDPTFEELDASVTDEQSSTVTEETVSEEDYDLRQLADQARQLFGRRTSRDLYDDVMGKFDKSQQFFQRASDLTDSFDMTGALDSLGTVPGLFNAGSKIGGFAGEGALGSSIGNIAGSIGSLASKAAIPLAVGAAAWTGINKGAEFYRDTSMSGKEEGLTGAGAFFQGLENRGQDFFRGLNPFTSSSSKDFAAYREMSLNSPFHIRSDSEEYETYVSGMSSMKDMGLDPRHFTALFGKAIQEDPDFDVDDALKELSENAREAGVSLKEMAESSQEYQRYLMSIGADKTEASSDAQELYSLMHGVDGAFAEGSALGELPESVKMGAIKNLTSTEGSFYAAQVLSETDPLVYEEYSEKYGNDTVGMMMDVVSSSPETAAALVQDVIYNMGNAQSTGNYTLDRSILARVLGVSEDQITRQTIDAITKGNEYFTSGEDARTVEPLPKTLDFPVERLLRDLIEPQGNLSPGQQQVNLTIDVRLDNNLVADISSVQSSDSPYAAYQYKPQTGRLGSMPAVTTSSTYAAKDRG